MQIPVLVALLLTSTVIAADPPKPSSPFATAADVALAKYAKAEKAADEAREKALRAPRETLVRELTAAMQAATKAGDLQAATRISDQLDEAKDELVTSTLPRTEELVISAYIDGNTELHLTPTGIFWKLIGAAAKVGKHEGKNEPTIVNGAKWEPEWVKPAGESAFERSKPLVMNLGRAQWQYKVMAIGTTLKAQSIDNRSPTSERVDGNNYVVSIPDKDQGARWYTIRVFRK